MEPTRTTLACATCALVLCGSIARAQSSAAPASSSAPPDSSAAPASGSSSSPPPAASPAPAPSVLDSLVRLATRAQLTPSGYIESFYQWNFNQPSNGITNVRGFDDRHNSFTISNVVLDLGFALDSVSGRIALQVGHTPESYYLAEPTDAAMATGAGTTGPNVWKYIQQANLGWRAPIGRGLLLEAGIFLSPVGPEALAVKDSWNYSRSDLFYGLPFYHAGIRATYPITDRLSVMLMGCNGWNSVVDNNDEKSVTGEVSYSIPDRLAVNLLYFGGVERPRGSAATPEWTNDRPWRHLFDLNAFVYPTPWLSFLVHLDAGYEHNHFGDAGWYAGALYARVRPLSWLFVTARGDYFAEILPAGTPASDAIFWQGAAWVGSFTGTIDVHPQDNLSVRLEFRHDESDPRAPLYYAGATAIDATNHFVPNAHTQNTITFGAVAWF